MWARAHGRAPTYARLRSQCPATTDSGGVGLRTVGVPRPVSPALLFRQGSLSPQPRIDLFLKHPVHALPRPGRGHAHLPRGHGVIEMTRPEDLEGERVRRRTEE